MTRRLQIVRDMAVNLMATALPIGVLQLVALPMLASHFDETAYGIAITMASFFSFCPAAIGNVLNNIRLIHNKEAERAGESGNIAVLLWFGMAISLVATVIYAAAFFQLDTMGLVLVAATSGAWLLQAYGIVEYLIKVDFRGVLLNNVVLALGYVVGLGMAVRFARWELLYFCGQVACLAYIAVTTRILSERPACGKLFCSMLKETAILGASSLLGQVSTYCDRLILFPLLGAASVSVYYVSTLLAKIIGLASSSINSVLLSHLAKMGSGKTRGFRMALLVGFAVCCVSYVIVVVVARPCLSVLYPQFVDEAMVFVPVTSITAFVTVLFRLANPFVLNALSTGWQVVIATTSTVLYLVLALGFLSFGGLAGFCWGALAAECCKLGITIVIYKFAKERKSFAAEGVSDAE